MRLGLKKMMWHPNCNDLFMKYELYFFVFFSFHLVQDGTPARVAAITEGLRMFKPDLLHVWSLKTLWHEYPKVLQRWQEKKQFLK